MIYLFWPVCFSVNLPLTRANRQTRKSADKQTGLANKVDTSINKSGWGRNDGINSNNLANQFVWQNCKQISHFSVHLPKVEEVTNAGVVSWSKCGNDDPQAGPNILILPCLQSSKLIKHSRANTSLLENGKNSINRQLQKLKMLWV